ncbi:heavy-metal-associated domain-containing protein [Patescibacteria group bacterium]|nr:heavy-metal-associated domain-containing protein [Patescibacteria group bacterium]
MHYKPYALHHDIFFPLSLMNSNNKFTLHIGGMGSDHCAGIVKKVIESFDSVLEVQTSFANQEAKIAFNDDTTPEIDEIMKAIKEAGYEPAQPIEE